MKNYKIAFMSQTGDAGKSMLAFGFGVYSLRQKQTVQLFDLDKEHETSTEWFNDREKYKSRNTPKTETVSSAVQAISKTTNNHQVTIYDCPSRATDASIKIAENVDLVVIPTPPSLKNKELTVKFIGQLIASGVKTKIVIANTRVRTNKELLNNMKFYEEAEIGDQPLEKWGITILENHLPDQTAYSQAVDAARSIIETSYLSLNKKAEALLFEIATILVATKDD